jgi:cation diffusion facilitator CzcD-associated flavoprotein CzcO
VVDKYDIRKLMRFNHKAIEATWDDTTAKWHVRFHRLDTNEFVEDSADVLVTATGTLNEWKWPDIPGIHSFKGPLLHSANWDDSVDFKVC